MGIPKFFRWISERYPLCSQVITENRIPEFDNLYLDMNGIIHNCSHPNDGDAHFRLTEDQIFLAIFNYIDHLFTRISPKKLFFLAVDGVAPRAKMNQQRSRRFRTAKDSAELHKKAIARGEKLPEAPPFDSNCITPGTPFMARLQEQLKYFINKKITEDASWGKIEVILSGHEVPGEGEHKIMEYLRLAKSQPGYDPNVRHCLYGLDADLMMLGLLSHEPHFALLREEVTFGKSKKKTSGGLESQSFYLMHLSLFREYLDAEFSTLRDSLPYEYDLERIIDDFILLAYFVGNDFLPNLPGLHINEGALASMFKVYKTVLVEGGGYMNDGGKLHLERVELFLKKLGDQEREHFEVEIGDAKWLQSKRSDSGKSKSKKSAKPALRMSPVQKKYYDQIKLYVLAGRKSERLMFTTDMPARDRVFILNLAAELGLNHTIDALGEGKELPQHHIIFEIDADDDDEDDEESLEAQQRILRKWDAAEIIDEMVAAAQEEAAEKQQIDDYFVQWKASYYLTKMGIDYHKNKEDLRKLVYHYVEGLQWIAYYYYNGVASWEWFYPYHYAPRITDLTDLPSLDLKFDLGQPFLPFEQLMGVLPAASSAHIPAAFRDLMTNPNSPIIDFYPEEFELDMNGKKADWEAIVKIPFIEEKRLLKSLKARENQLTKEEKSRNRVGDSYSFSLDAASPHNYKSPLPVTFPDINNCVCKMSLYDLPVLASGGFRKGLCKGARTGVKMLAGFPSLQTLSHTATLGYHGVTVFQIESKNESVVVSLHNRFEGKSPETIAKLLIGKTVYVNWPFLLDAKVVSITDELCKYNLVMTGDRQDIEKVPLSRDEQNRHYKSCERIEAHYSKRYGTITGPIEVFVTVRALKGMKLLQNGALIRDFGTASDEIEIGLQTIVNHIVLNDRRYVEKPPLPLNEEFPAGSRVIFLAAQGYGLLADLITIEDEKLKIKLLKPADNTLAEGLHFTRTIASTEENSERYVPSWQAAKQLRMSGLALSKITSSLHVISTTLDQRINLGLNLKFEAQKKKVLGYSRKSDSGWEFSQKAVALIRDYQQKFPEVFAALERKSRTDLYEDADFFPPAQAAEKMSQMKDWLKAAGVKDLEKVALNTKGLTKGFIKQIEDAIDHVYKEVGELKTKAVIVKNVPREAVLKPAHAKHRLSHQKFDLGDRVVYATDTGNLPVGMSGTIVGIDESYLDVVFDQTFMGGTSLGDRCTPGRGLTLHKDALLNVTHIQPPIDGCKPIKVEPINRPIPKFAMRAGGGNVTTQKQEPNWTEKEASAAPPPSKSAWGEGVPPELNSQTRRVGANRGQHDQKQQQQTQQHGRGGGRGAPSVAGHRNGDHHQHQPQGDYGHSDVHRVGHGHVGPAGRGGRGGSSHEGYTGYSSQQQLGASYTRGSRQDGGSVQQGGYARGGGRHDGGGDVYANNQQQGGGYRGGYNQQQQQQQEEGYGRGGQYDGNPAYYNQQQQQPNGSGRGGHGNAASHHQYQESGRGGRGDGGLDHGRGGRGAGRGGRGGRGRGSSHDGPVVANSNY